MSIISIRLTMIPAGWAQARPSFPDDQIGVYVFWAEAAGQQVPLRVGQTTASFQQRMYGSTGHHQAFSASLKGDARYIASWPNYVSFFDQMSLLAADGALANTTVSLLALSKGSLTTTVRQAEKLACRYLVPVWEMKDEPGLNRPWKMSGRRWRALDPQPLLAEFVDRRVGINSLRRLDVGAVMRQVEKELVI